MRKPYRVVVFGPGAVGAGCLRELARMPEFEIVGVRAYNPEKDGKDIGDVIGIPRVGVPMTTDMEKILPLKTDCVLYFSKMYGGDDQTTEMIRLLEAGHNVITVGPYRAMDLVQKDMHKRFQAACLKGGSTFFSTGVDPEFFSERLVMTLSALSYNISHVEVWEISPSDTIGEESLKLAGFGRAMEDVLANPNILNLGRTLLTPSMVWVGEKMGFPITRIDVTPQHVAAPFDIDIGRAKAPKGTLAAISRRFECYSGDHLFYTHNDFYYLSPLGPPKIAPSPDCYVVMVEGQPSFKVTLSASASLKEDRLYDTYNPVKPAFIATSALAVKAIPAVVAAPPGVKENDPPDYYWTRDLRNLAAEGG